MAIETLIAQYGLFAILLGAAVEGETVVFIGGVLAHRGLLSFTGVAIAASIGSFVADQIFFLIGRYARGSARVQAAMARPIFVRVTGLLEQYPTAFILAFRFIYGMRTISPIAIGVSQVPTGKFVVLNAVAAAIWGPLIAGVGYVFGTTIQRIMSQLPIDPHAAIFVIVVLIIAGFVAFHVAYRRH
ncbi:DedA family protein [Rhizobium sp. CFBP 8762]|uniref:VTT domain-containing protein n=1 Tax=Rhizobium sp. CFBP 8762 TaxID=2775279 RepID=UPI001780A41F|nr:DedA family protein [Rhizobium sp. CFBP 8762]